MAQVLQVDFHFEKQQFVLSFDDPKMAEQYRLANPHSQRGSLTDVRLPLPTSMSSLQVGPAGTSVIFRDASHASAWEQQVLLGTRDETNTRSVYLKHNWMRGEMEGVISGKAGQKQTHSVGFTDTCHDYDVSVQLGSGES